MLPSTYFSSMDIIIGGRTSIGIGRTTLVRAVSSSAWKGRTNQQTNIRLLQRISGFTCTEQLVCRHRNGLAGLPCCTNEYTRTHFQLCYQLFVPKWFSLCCYKRWAGAWLKSRDECRDRAVHLRASVMLMHGTTAVTPPYSHPNMMVLPGRYCMVKYLQMG